ncbi:MAG: mRNA surveillance protein pelota [Desulfurococcaceae archaeon]
MKILEKDIKHGYIVLQIETIDDLWVLYNVIIEGDIVYAKTTREVKVGDGSQGSRIPMILGVKVGKVEFQQFGSNLRVNGLVIEGPDEYGVVGKYHTLSIGVGDVVKIVKTSWREFEEKLISNYSRSRGNILAVLIDHDEACIGVITEQGVKHIWEKALDLPSKHYQADYDSLLRGYINEVVRVVLNTVSNENCKAVIIAGPGELKHSVKSELSSRVQIPVYIDTISTGGCKGVKELLNRDVVREVIGELNILRAMSLFEEFKRLLVKDHDYVVYGPRDVYEASINGAIQTLIVVDELLRTPSDEERELVYKALETTMKSRGEVIVVPGKSDIGVELNGFGGIIAILRFKLYKI